MILALLALALADPWDAPLTLHGIGTLRIGTPVAALRRMGATGERYPDEEVDCAYWQAPRWPGLAMMVSGGRVVRIETEDPRYRTASGARVGMTEAEIRRLYGPAMRVEPHPYTGPEGHYLVYRARGEPYGLIVETDHETGRARSIRVGTWQAVELIEGCS
ncbi:MAG TPA: hypothetical protein VGW40_03665 [Allosphingosinicella sp.]|nr:hypothetical protein [Allosphingosinicella sp.]